MNPQPYWGFDDLFHKVGSKLHNCFYILADSKVEEGIEYFQYDLIYKLSSFSQDRFIQAIEDGILIAEFDARTGHNHGAKFRFNKGDLPKLYENVELIS
ncbi:MAG: MvaI/BcnI family restriction endonuclease [Alphaproteobacteria bacterium]|nr:MvaI/BcnI family restriction endonuclease [Alphaproteobacteria bacterium]